MQIIEKTEIWKRTLAVQDQKPDEHAEPREKLRVAFQGFREQAETLAGQIDASLSGLTVHDITHIDALWEYADRLVGNDFPITPL